MIDKKPSISSLLNKPHLQTVQSEVLPTDPVIPTRIRATLDQLIAYKDNPRQTKNPMYDEIKESIRNRGLDHAPNVTRKDPADPYMIKDGGNTRLQILRELWEETGDEKFYSFDLMFHPWTNELDVLIGHMIENEMRGNMIFIERAIAARNVKNQLEDEEVKELSIRELAKRISAEGWSLDHANLGFMLYAEEKLLQVIPDALWSGIGIDRVKKIRKLLDCCRTYWDAVSTAEEGDFDDIWKPVFAKLDGDGFDVSAAEYQLCGAMAVRMDGPVMSVTAQIQALLEGIKGIELVRPSRFEPPVIPPAAPPKPKSTSSTQATTSTVETNNTQRNLPPAQSVTTTAGNSTIGGNENSQSTLGQQPNSVGYSAATEQVTAFSPAPIVEQNDSVPRYALSEIPGGSPIHYQYLIDLSTASLQSRAHEIARSYANRFGLEKNIFTTEGRTDLHMGFWVSSEGLAQMDHDTRIHWVFLSQYAFIRNDNQAHLLLENMMRALGEELDIPLTVSLIMNMSYARANLLGARLRTAQAITASDLFLHEAWEEVTELEAITGVILTRDFEESQRVDDTPDQTFIGQ